MKFSFINYLWEIWTIGKARNVDIGVALDMLVADIQNGEAKEFNTGGALPDFDFVGLKSTWEALTDVRKAELYNECSDTMREHYEQLCELYTALTEGE